MIPNEDKKAIYKIADMPMPAGKITDRDMLETIAQALALLSLKVCIVREMLTASPNKAARADIARARNDDERRQALRTYEAAKFEAMAWPDDAAHSRFYSGRHW